MELTYHGHSCVRLRGREMTVVVDPPQTTLPGLAKGTVGIIVRTEGATDPERFAPATARSRRSAGRASSRSAASASSGLPPERRR